MLAGIVYLWITVSSWTAETSATIRDSRETNTPTIMEDLPQTWSSRHPTFERDPGNPGPWLAIPKRAALHYILHEQVYRVCAMINH